MVALKPRAVRIPSEALSHDVYVNYRDVPSVELVIEVRAVWIVPGYLQLIEKPGETVPLDSFSGSVAKPARRKT